MRGGARAQRDRARPRRPFLSPWALVVDDRVRGRMPQLPAGARPLREMDGPLLPDYGRS